MADVTALVEGKFREWKLKLDHLAAEVEKYRHKNESVQKLFGSLQKELLSVSAEECEPGRMSIIRFTDEMNSFVANSSSLLERLQYSVINSCKQLSSEASGHQDTITNYRSKKSAKEKEEKALDKMIGKNDMTAQRGKVARATSEFSNAKLDFVASTKEKIENRLVGVKKLLLEFCHTHIESYARGLEMMTRMYHTIDAMDVPSTLEENLRQLGLQTLMEEQNIDFLPSEKLRRALSDFPQRSNSSMSESSNDIPSVQGTSQRVSSGIPLARTHALEIENTMETSPHSARISSSSQSGFNNDLSIRRSESEQRIADLGVNRGSSGSVRAYNSSRAQSIGDPGNRSYNPSTILNPSLGDREADEFSDFDRTNSQHSLTGTSSSRR